MTHTVKRAFRYRFYPTEEQAAELLRTFGCVRKVYNLALAARMEASRRSERISYGQTSAMLTAWKKTDEFAYLCDVSSVPLQQTLRHLQTAFARFWEKKAHHPRFKSKKRSRASAEYTRSAFRYEEGHLTLSKMAKPLKIVWSRPLPSDARPSTVTVTRDSARRWFVSMLCEDIPAALPQVEAAIGIDVGIASLATLSTGERVANPRHERRERGRLAKAQRELNRKEKGSANYDKARVRVARVHARINDRRKDHLNQLTTRLVRDNQTLVIEDLSASNLMKNRVLARAISDAGWREFRSMLEYKAAWYGRNLIVVDRWFPSSKLCSHCGIAAAAMPLGVRQWMCTACGSSHDRDVNAARNILAAGLAVTACGDSVRPHQGTLCGQQSLKQEAQRATAGISFQSAGRSGQ